MKNNILIRVLLLCTFSVVFLQAVSSCGGSGGSDEPEASIAQSELSSQRRLVADFSDTSILLKPKSLEYLKSNDQSEAGTADGDISGSTVLKDEEIEIEFLQKWTTADEIKPALYVIRDTSLTIPNDSSAKQEDADGSTSGQLQDGIVLNEGIGDLGWIYPTLSGDVYFTFTSSVEYDQDKTCRLFVVDRSGTFKCADDVADVEVVGSDRRGNLYYQAYNGTDVVLRMVNSSDGIIKDIAGLRDWQIRFSDDNGYEKYSYDGIKIMPNGTIIVWLKVLNSSGVVIKKISNEGIYEKELLDLKMDMSSFFPYITVDGRLVICYMKKMKDKYGGWKDTSPYLMVAPFDGEVGNSGEIDLSVYSISMLSGFIFFWDDNNNLWFLGDQYSDKKKAFGYVRLDTSVNLIMNEIEVDSAIISADHYLGSHLSKTPEGTDKIVGLRFEGEKIFEDPLFETSSMLSIGEMYSGKDGREFFSVGSPYGDGLGFLDADGEFNFFPVFGNSTGSLYSIYPGE